MLNQFGILDPLQRRMDESSILAVGNLIENANGQFSRGVDFVRHLNLVDRKESISEERVTAPGRTVSESERWNPSFLKIKNEKKYIRFVPFYRRSQRRTANNGKRSRDATTLADGKVVRTGFRR
jgi:hypothetical protein